jgi:hypothetical protein
MARSGGRLEPPGVHSDGGQGTSFDAEAADRAPAKVDDDVEDEENERAGENVRYGRPRLPKTVNARASSIIRPLSAGSL